MGERSAEEMAAALSLLLHQKLGVRSGGLEAKIARAGRRLPARIRRRAMEIVEAAKREGSPRLARLNDTDALRRAFDEVERHLSAIDPAERRRTAILGVLGSVSLALLVTAGGLIAWLVWSGAL